MTKNKENKVSIQEALIDIYLSVKIRRQEEIENLNEDLLLKEKESLKKTDPLTLIEYIKNSIDILINLKVEEKLEIERNLGLNGDQQEKQNEYEVLLRKLESDIRSHIKIEHQLKLFSEGLQQRIEDLEKESEEKNKIYKQMKEELMKHKTPSEDKKDIEIKELKKELSNYKQILKSYEDQNLKISELEKKLRNQNLKREKEIKNLETNYEDKINALNKKILYLEEKIKSNTNSNYKSYILKNDNSMKSEKYESSINDSSIDKSKTKLLGISNTENKLSFEIPKKLQQQFEKLNEKKNDIFSLMNRANTSFAEKSHGRNDEGRSLSNKSRLLTKDKSMNDASKTSMNYNSFINKIDDATKKMITKEKYKTHYKQFSMDFKPDKNKFSLPYKNIQLVKEILISQNANSSSSTQLTHSKDKKSTSKDIKTDAKRNLTNKITTSNSSSLLNQNGMVCFNNINIFNTNKNTSSFKNPKTNDINLRQYLLNRVNGEKNGKINGTKHTRSTSNYLING